MDRATYESQIQKHPETKEQAEASINKLKEMLQEEETAISSFEKKTKLFLILFIICAVITAGGYISYALNKETTREILIPAEEFVPWTENAETDEGVTFDFSSLRESYTMTVSISNVTRKFYTGFYIVSNDQGQDMVLYLKINNMNDATESFIRCFPEIKTVTADGTERIFIPDGVVLTAKGRLSTSEDALKTFIDSGDLSSREIIEKLSRYTFIDLDDTTIKKTETIEGAEERGTLFRCVWLIGLTAGIVFLVLWRIYKKKIDALNKEILIRKSDMMVLERMVWH